MQRIGTAKMLVDTDFAAQADKLLLGEAGGEDPNPEETLTEAEFLIAVLKDNDIVDDLTVTAIRLQFAHIVRHDTSGNEQKVLDDKAVFLEMLSQGRIVQISAGAPATTEGGHAVEQVDLSNAKDGGFNEWREKHWWPRVFDGKEHGTQVRMAALRPTEGHESGPGGKRAPAAEAAAMRASSQAVHAQAPMKTITAGGEVKTFARLQDENAAVAGGEGRWTYRANGKPAPAEEEQTCWCGQDTGLWLCVLLLVLLIGWRLYMDGWFGGSDDDDDGGAGDDDDTGDDDGFFDGGDDGDDTAAGDGADDDDTGDDGANDDDANDDDGGSRRMARRMARATARSLLAAVRPGDRMTAEMVADLCTLIVCH